MSLKQPGSPLRLAIKEFKKAFDDPGRQRTLALLIWRRITLGWEQIDEPWEPEGLHSLAIYRESVGDLEYAETYFVRSMAAFEPHEQLGLARVMRDRARFVATHFDPHVGKMVAEQALALHDVDVNRYRRGKAAGKARRQRRITECYLWYIRLLCDDTDQEAREALVSYALGGSSECGKPDIERIIEFALCFAEPGEKVLLDAKLAQSKVSRGKIVAGLSTAIRTCIDAELFLLGKTYRTLRRKG